MPLSNEDLIASARRWTTIWEMAEHQLTLAMADPHFDEQVVRILNRSATTAAEKASRQLSALSFRGLNHVALSIRKARRPVGPPTVPFALRLAEAPLDCQEVADAVS